ncbi:helix-turn-helix domain-containing protein [Oceanobacillus oncorhynchi]|uniref:helix-turn-helix domain-containing protein n=1 Tax=Oceanobacillus oncorhynchi TaxID=545501 RepID=UPI0034D5A38F
MKGNREISSDFADLIEDYRIQKGVSLNKLAEAADISPGYLSRLLTGKRLAPSVPIVTSLAKELDIPLRKILKVIGLDNEIEDIATFLINNEFTFRGRVVEPDEKEAIVNILNCFLPYITKGDNYE